MGLGLSGWWADVTRDDVRQWSSALDPESEISAIEQALKRSWYRCRRQGSILQVRWSNRFGPPPLGELTVEGARSGSVVTLRVPCYLRRHLAVVAGLGVGTSISAFAWWQGSNRFITLFFAVNFAVTFLHLLLIPWIRSQRARRIARPVMQAVGGYLAPAGWYADPESSSERWWDGRCWTNQRRSPFDP